MTPVLEKDIEAKACRKARERGWLAYKFTSPARRAVPDRLFIKNGQAVFIEFKRPGGRLTTLQAQELARLREAGMPAHVCFSVDEALALLDAHDADPS